MTGKEDFENDSRYHLYCELLLEIPKNEQKNRKKILTLLIYYYIKNICFLKWRLEL